MSLGSQCLVCGEGFGSEGYKCSRCRLKIHAKCFESDPERAAAGCSPEHSQLIFEAENAEKDINPPSSPNPAPFSSSSSSPTISGSIESSPTITRSASQIPLIAFVNSRSGGGQGKAVFQKLRKLLSRDQVYDLSQGGPKPGLEAHRKTENLTILACGGDGTCCWVLSVLDDMGWPQPYPPMAILPLGTGNDLSRALGWGPGYQDEDLSPILKKIAGPTTASISLDRWRIWHLPTSSSPPVPPPRLSVSTEEVEQEGKEKEEEEEKEGDGEVEEAISGITMNNYWSVGVDAMVALEFHQKREENPALFMSRTVNKGWYGWYGMRKMAGTVPLNSYLKLWMDGKEVPLSEKLEGLIVLNIASYAGGCDLWGKEEGRPVSTADGFLELVGITSTFHMAKIQTGAVSAKRIGQAASIKIQLDCEMATQVDGEPKRTKPGTILIDPHTPGTMLACENSPSFSQSLPLV
eukprot:CAMPEP_0201517084 /NCGR_PEP_ID=MMETSP0161_2-20130828/8291_1 /ASSEMBLY_ACC=CAM_ASM_000251 /TAXON_ID=180227 /ORGANISM="Neoparamoeba aestuarina, Strain SoJaBio B1-5/56/2" /LENGTH=463 /DNA_ID=CAMNT_0047914495 /DNA_START=357 /DNA_END=1748 /DNA_ORIENTATION=+